MPKLKFLTGPAGVDEFDFDKTVVIGRGPLADLSLEDPVTSRRHAMMTWSDDECYVSDLDSGNGTWVNGKRIVEPTRLRDGDQINVGTVLAQFAIERPQKEVDTDASVILVDSAIDKTQIFMTMAPSQAEAQEAAPLKDGTIIQPSVSRRFSFLNELSKAVAENPRESAVLSFVLEQLFVLMPRANRAFIMVQDAEQGELVPRLARTRSGEAEAIPVSRTLLDDVVDRREGVLLVESDQDEKYTESRSLHSLNIKSAVCAPIVTRDELYGVIQVDSTSVVPLGKSDLALLMGIASQVAVFMAYGALHARMLERELVERDLMLARRIQQQFLPDRLPKLDGYAFSVEYSPALAVGGDFYTFIELADGRLGVILGDVSGKGVSAALYVAKLSSDIRYYSAGQDQPSEIMRRVNYAMAADSAAGMFVTVALIAIDAASGRITVASGGHPLPLLRRPDGQINTVGLVGDPPLGMTSQATFRQETYVMSPGDMVLIYSDGVNEAEDIDRGMFGDGRICESIAAGGDVDTTRDRLLVDLKRFVGDASQSDDITLVAFSRNGT